MKNRIAEIDVLRGFAILLIFPANIAMFSAYQMSSYSDYALVWLFHLLFDGVLYSLFTLLFGMGMGLQLQADGFRGKWFRRMTVLFGIGIAHGLLLSQADILAVYAILGYLLYFVRHWKSERLLAVAFMLLAIPFTFNALLWLLDVPMQASTAIYDPRFLSTWMDVFSARFEQWQLYFLGQLLITFPNFTAMMLIGTVLARTPVQQWDTAEFRFLGYIGFLAMVGYATIYTFRHGNIINLGNALITVGAPMLALGCIGVLLWLTERYRSMLIFAAAGRMSLSLYILQSVYANLIFIGFGWYGQLTLTEILPRLIWFWAVQLAFSVLWLRWFNVGPVEWLWRKFVYSSSK